MTKDRPNTPTSVLIAGERYVATLMRIECRDDQNRPEGLILLPEDRTVEVSDGDEFLIAYVKESLVRR